MQDGLINSKYLEITSVQNTKVKLVSKLWNRREREKTQLFLIEGYRELTRAFSGGQHFQTLFFCPDLFLGENEYVFIEKCRKHTKDIYRCSEKVFRTFSYRDRPDGLLAVAVQQHSSLDTLSPQKNSLFVVAESIEKPGNLGTILRSCDAVGVDGVIVCDRCTDIHNPNVVRASVGALFTIPVIESSSEAALNWLKKQGIKVLAATPSAKEEFTQIDMQQPIAIVVGTEQYGLSSLWMDSADIQLKIPMRGMADSLNVAMATTLLLYEALRQRS